MKEKLNPKKLDDLKKINLIELANKYNYKLDKKESTKKWTVLRNGHDDKLLVHQNQNGHWAYTNLHNDDDKGSVYDFMKKEHPKMSFKEIVAELSRFEPSLAPEKDLVTSTANVFDSAQLKNISGINKDNISYLTQERKIDADILLNDSKFKDKVKIYSSGKFKNFAFPISNENKAVSGFILKNKDFSGYLKSSEHANSLWVSNYDKTKALDKLLIAESPIDAMSHYQLNKNELQNKNVAYMATGGSLTKGQIGLVDKFVAAKALSNVETIFDNDLAGKGFTAKFNGELQSLKKSDVSVIKHIGFSTQKDNPSVKMNISFSKTDEKSLSGMTKDLDKEGAVKFGTATSIQPNGSGKLEISFPKDSNTHWKQASGFLNEFNKNKVMNAFSISKDFNKDLQNLMKNQQSFKNVTRFGIPKN